MSKANPQLRALFLIMGATVLSTTALQFYLATNIIDNEAELVRQSFDIRHVDLFLSALKDAETGQRGYLLTGNDRYLEPFQKAKVEIKKEINELEIRARATGGELFANFLVKARGFSELKMTELQHTIDVRKSRGLKPALSIVASGPGQEFMDQLRALVDGFKAKKSAEINVSTHRRDRLIRLRNAVWLLFFLLNAGILAWSFWRLKLSINKRLRNEQILHEQAALLSLAHDAIIVRSAQDKVIFWNSGAKEVYGWTAEEALGRVTHELFKTRFPKPLPEIMDDVAKQKRWDGELIHARKDGKEIVVASRWAAEPDASGKLLRMLEINRDITQSKRSEKELLAAREDAQRATLVAEEASQSKSIFLANMSHEIRTPLGAVLGFSELLANEKLAASDRAKFATIVKRNGKLLSNIISDVLDLSKIEAGECEIEKQDVAIQEVLSDVTTVMSLRAMDKGLKLTVSASGAIPTRIRTDLLRLRQVLINIVGNAIKFTSKGSIEVTIQQVPGDNGVKLAFVVSDTGLGISPEHAAKLFAPFVQADSSTKRKFGGTGLGLALSKRLAGLLGGDVALTKSALGRGSTFTITIDPGPIRDLLFESADGAWSDIPTIPFASVGRDRLKDRRVLVVDDSIDNRVLVTRYLQLEGAIVESAKNGKEAVEMVHKKPYDVLLMDLQMPVMDGFEATAALRREGYKCPVIALTAHALKEERERCLSNGFDAHLPKPIDRLALVEALAQRCGTNQA